MQIRSNLIFKVQELQQQKDRIVQEAEAAISEQRTLIVREAENEAREMKAQYEKVTAEQAYYVMRESEEEKRATQSVAFERQQPAHRPVLVCRLPGPWHAR